MRELVSLSIASATGALQSGDPVGALEWLGNVPIDQEQPLRSQIHYALGKRALSRGDWREARDEFGHAASVAPAPAAQMRVGLLRNRARLIPDSSWATLRAAVDTPDRLPQGGMPPLTSIWACGAYYSRHKRGAPWSRFVRLAKNPVRDNEERSALVTLATGFMCRYILEEATLLGEVDAVVPVPADPERYSQRGMSLPDELARAIESQLVVPEVRGALRHTKISTELRGLSWSERRRAVRELLEVGDYDPERWPSVLVVDDVITSGATMQECARLLLSAGAQSVHGIALAHTEG